MPIHSTYIAHVGDSLARIVGGESDYDATAFSAYKLISTDDNLRTAAELYGDSRISESEFDALVRDALSINPHFEVTQTDSSTIVRVNEGTDNSPFWSAL